MSSRQGKRQEQLQDIRVHVHIEKRSLSRLICCKTVNAFLHITSLWHLEICLLGNQSLPGCRGDLPPGYLNRHRAGSAPQRGRHPSAHREEPLDYRAEYSGSWP
ncbi:hypothetical protein UPYG_G00031840 [Umbra pygmaea]|uniref:Uncharacterized protein n=1 Tax=Umbra pygmaea TaxID=75934 RepID=A0ABD0XN19_UMBPY